MRAAFRRREFVVATIQVGQTIPDVELGYIPYSPELDDPIVCGLPSKIRTHKDWKGKKIVIFGIPGSFTKTCSESHLPPYVTSYDQFKAKGVDSIYCIASNDLFVQSAFGRASKTGDKVICVGDPELKFLEPAGLTQDLSHVGFGVRAKRFALIVDDLKASLPLILVTYVGEETGPGVGPSGAEAVLAKL
ncbi:Redoxin [Rhodotorula diobovata]|uniref:Redoxin n=1 Tax=Rhodotorula diobovata TaxID=5288 RepID=A0A5C5FV18_9BASI|nr:Redoxin [Rhodotorula diobovata]